MKPVLIDTNIWSTYLRRNAPEDLALRQDVEYLIREGVVQMIGPVRQEILSGIRDYKKYALLREYLSAFDVEMIVSSDYELAAKITNDCMAKGIAISAVDAVIVSMVHSRGWTIYTRDKDFDRYCRVIRYDRYVEGVAI